MGAFLVRSRALTRALLCGTALAVAVAGLELAIRTFNPQTLGSAIFEPGTDGFSRLKKNFETRLRGPEYDIQIRLNSHGLRDVERDEAKPANVTRVLVVGDSFTMGAGVNLDETYAKQAERGLNSGHDPRRYDVINAGVQNWGTGEQLVVLDRDWMQYAPDAVLLTFQHTDFTDNLQHRLWELREGRLRRLPIRQDPPPGSAVSRVWGYHWTLTHSHLATFARNTFFQALYARERAASEKAVAIAHAEDDADEDYAWKLTGQLLLAMHDAVTDRGLPFAIAYAPSREEVEAFRQYGRREAIEQFVAHFAETHAIPFTSLVSPLAAAGPIDLVYYPKDGHWTVKGHQVVAAAITSFLRTIL